jgi:2-desacetyl-2-hydroxyethyl bacteriochlorophyllide A dehydrogenase
MDNWSVVFEKPFSAALKKATLDKELKDDQILVKTLRSLVSPGTELAIYKGMESWAPLPYSPGYASIGEVVETGAGVKDFKKGEVIFSYAGHREYSVVSENDILVKVPEEAAPREAVFTRMAAVSITALRVSPPELGDNAAVIGMGIVGNLAAQLFALSGAVVTGIDVSEGRLSTAKKCGVTHTVNSAKEDMKNTVMSLTGGRGCSTVVEATGVPALVESAFSITAKTGDVVLLGSPRGKLDGDITALLNKVHLWGNGCVSLKGAHEWRYPRKPSEGCKHSLQRNCEIIMSLIASGKLQVKPLITHDESPKDCQNLYQGLLNNKDKYLGVVFDWTKI